LTRLKQLTILSLHVNPKLAKSEIEKLMKALPKCRFHHMTRK
jgi:hypothetical protein